MANPKKHRSSRRSRRSRNGKRRNPVRTLKMRTFRRHGRRRNPASIGGFSANELIKLALGAAAGTLATKYATSLILQEKNNGPMGYGVMAAVAVALGWASAKFIGRDVATGVVAGGVGAVVLRIFQENISGSTPAAMSGLGDPDFPSNGMGSLAEYQTGTYPVPGWGYGAPQAALPAAAMQAGVIAAPARAARSNPRS